MNAPNKPTYAHPLPHPNGEDRRNRAATVRARAEAVSRRAVGPVSNGECETFAYTWPTNFTKGLPHDVKGIVDPDAFKLFVDAINTPDFDFEVPLGPENAPGAHRPTGYAEKPSSVKSFAHPANPSVRGWESPVAGHVYALEGPDAGSVGMAPAPRLGSDELAAEMAEVYAMAILRDVPFTAFETGAADQVIAALNRLPWFDASRPVTDAGGAALDGFSQARRAARFVTTTALTPGTLFRGSTRGAQKGPFISQFLLQGTRDRSGGSGPENGLIRYGAQQIDQRVEAHEPGADYMTDWSDWLDVQNGANLKGSDRFGIGRRFLTTPRDIATFVHFDELYQAYLNTCLMLLALGCPADSGLPEKNATGTRDAFATFGGPHILTLVTETATRSLKAVRRQKYNIHLRARPEALAGIATLSKNGHGAVLGAAAPFAADHVKKLEEAEANGFSIMREIASRNGPTGGGALPEIAAGRNYLLPMAFPEGSPMHPSYGAGHATVAGSCTTMLKAFFELYSDPVARTPKTLAEIGMTQLMVPTPGGHALVPDTGTESAATLTVEGEIDKIAANIAIARNMAGVHYYADYYDSLRMGERIAVGILQEQLLCYPEAMSLQFTSFDGDALTLRHDGNPAGTPVLEVTDRNGSPVSEDAWFERHVPALVTA